MPDCDRCGKWFRDNYALNRHTERKKPCMRNTPKTEKPVKTDKYINE